jgi:hypothetical protein
VRNLLLLLIPLYLTFHLFTLSRQPLPTYEEATLATASNKITKNGLSHFKTIVSTSEQNDPALLSPLYVITHSLYAKYVLNNLFYFRLLGFVFGVLTLFVLFSYLGYFEKGSFKNASTLLIFAFVFDPILNQHIHSNGAIVMGVFFLLLSLQTEFKKDDHTFYSTLFSSICMALALLSYLPIAIMLPFLLLYKIAIALRGIIRKQFHLSYHLVFWPLLILLLLLPWILYANIHLIDILVNLLSADSLLTNLSLSYPYFFILIGTILTSIYGFLQKDYEIEDKDLVYLMAGMTVSFLLANSFWEKNFLVILPFLYLLIFSLLPLNITDNNARMGRYLPIVILLVFNSFVFLIQTISLGVDYNNRSDSYLGEFIQTYIPKDKAVLGDATASFALLENGYNYTPVKSSLDLNKKLKTKPAEFAVIGDDFESVNGYAGSTLEYEGFQKVAHIQYESSEVSQFLRNIGLIPNAEKELYSVQVYKRK